eukprot:TRINITY_DN66820_c6_g1_i1.p1 TRINITY_DN66820_c6_g1~~TRINITY_DN66820_c6_g1_i1.p1  ORF type:complete len:665 (+),score=433.29 TRINITY_DN66820_c6_g1_i1:82-2076(+)
MMQKMMMMKKKQLVAAVCVAALVALTATVTVATASTTQAEVVMRARFEGSEHRRVGNNGTVTIIDVDKLAKMKAAGQVPTKKVRAGSHYFVNAMGIKLTYGDIVFMAGDFFGAKKYGDIICHKPPGEEREFQFEMLFDTLMYAEASVSVEEQLLNYEKRLMRKRERAERKKARKDRRVKRKMARKDKTLGERIAHRAELLGNWIAHKREHHDFHLPSWAHIPNPLEKHHAHTGTSEVNPKKMIADAAAKRWKGVKSKWNSVIKSAGSALSFGKRKQSSDSDSDSGAFVEVEAGARGDGGMDVAADASSSGVIHSQINANHTYPDNEDHDNIYKIMREIRKEDEAIDLAIKAGTEPSEAMHKLGSTRWLKFRHMLKLAKVNFDHFAACSRKTYHAGHVYAQKLAAEARDILQEAMQLPVGDKKRGELIKEGVRLYDTGVMANAFADHFLSDNWAPGHLRTVREQVAPLCGKDSNKAGFAVKRSHDEDNHNGLYVTNKRGDHYWIYGDGSYMNSANAQGRQYASEASQVSRDDVAAALLKDAHDVTTSSVDKLLPIVDTTPFGLVQNTCPVYRMKGKTLQIREPFNVLRPMMGIAHSTAPSRNNFGKDATVTPAKPFAGDLAKKFKAEPHLFECNYRDAFEEMFKGDCPLLPKSAKYVKGVGFIAE